ncbi:MAG: hypothetical protein RLZ12_981 [Bacillota bacterium]
MVYLLVLLGTFFRGIAAFLLKVSCAEKVSGPALLFIYYAAGSIVSGWWVWQKSAFSLDLKTALVGSLLGLSIVGGTQCLLHALNNGPGGVTSAVINANAVFTIILAITFFGERPSFAAWLGVLAIVLGVVLLPIDVNQSLRINNVRWYYYVILGTILFFPRNGGLKLVVYYGLGKEMVLFIVHSVAWVFFAIALFLKRRRGKTIAVSFTNKTVIIGVLAGIGMALSMNLYALAIAQGPGQLSEIAAVFATSSLVVALLSRVVYSEKLSLMQVFSIFAIVGGTACIALCS